MTSKNFTGRDFRDAMGRFPTGVVVVSTIEDGQVHAMTANAFMSGSLEPPLVLVSLGQTTNAHKKIQASGVFGISILSEEQHHTSNHFAGKKIEGFTPEFDFLQGIPVIQQAPVRLVTTLQHCYPCGDHSLFVGEVLELHNESLLLGDPLLFHSGKYSKLFKEQ